MFLERSTWPAVQRYFAAGNDMVIIAIGSTEEHGRQNPLGTDTLAPNFLLDKIERAEGERVLIAPTIPYGAADDLLGYPGTLSIGYDLLYQIVRRLCAQLYDYGARRFVFLNGHGPNIKPLSQVGEELDRRGCRCALMNWWLMAGEINPAWAGGHGAGEETSAMLAVDPSLVDLDEFGEMGLVNDESDDLPTDGWSSVVYKGVHVGMPRDAVRYASNGWIGPDHVRGASKEWGDAMMDATAAYIVDFLGALRAAPLPTPLPVRAVGRPGTFADRAAVGPAATGEGGAGAQGTSVRGENEEGKGE
jgi:creatinine amidohydrolase